MHSRTHSENFLKENDVKFYMTSCKRFKNHSKSMSDCGKAVVYLSLRKKGCPKEKAVKFSSKSSCRLDSTVKLDGPSDYRILKTKPFNTSTLNGWQYVDRKYDLGRRVFMTYKDILLNDEEEKILKNHFDKNEQAIKGDFKKKIQSLLKYYNEVNTKFGFTKMNNITLYNTLKEINEKNQEKKFNSQVLCRVGSTPIIELANEYKEESKKNLNKTQTYIKEMEAFPSLISKEFLIKPKFNKEKSKFIPTIVSIKQRMKSRKHVNLRSNSNIDNPPKPQKLKNLLLKSSLFEILELQNKYISKITDATDLAEDLEKTKTSTKKNDLELYQMITGNLPKNSIAQEFNEANYVSYKESDKNSEDSKRNLISQLIKEKKRLGVMKGFEKYQHVKEKITNLLQEVRHQKEKEVNFENKMKKLITSTFQNSNSGQVSSSEISNIHRNNLVAIRNSALAKIFKQSAHSKNSTKTTFKEFASFSQSTFKNTIYKSETNKSHVKSQSFV